MQYRHRLRSRITLSFLLFGTLLSLLFAVSTLLLHRYLENQLIGATLKSDLGDFVATLRNNPGTVEAFSTRTEGWVTRPGDPNLQVPTRFRDLSAGVHDVETETKTYKAAVHKADDLWVFLTYDVSDNRRLASQLLIAVLSVVALFSMLSFALGSWSSRRVMRPVTDLARRLNDPEHQRYGHALAARFADDEVGQLAAALDNHAQALQQMVDRDRAFNADVSHELRTPLAVISGATELLLAQPDLSDKTRTRLLRIARAARQSADITAALLHLVRAERGSSEDSTAQNIRTIANKLIELYQPLIGNKPVSLNVQENDAVNVIAPESVIAVTLGNLIGNAIRYTQSGTVDVTIGSGAVTVLDTGPGIPEDELPKVVQRHYRGSQSSGKGAGLGLAIVSRLCELYGWQINFSNRPTGGLSVELRFYGTKR